MNMLLPFSLILTLSFSAFSVTEPKGRIQSPFEACKDVIIASSSAYSENAAKWDEYAKSCNSTLQFTSSNGLMKDIAAFDSMKEGAWYIEFAQKVAKKVVENLDKSKRYSDCSALCFKGSLSCPASLSEGKEPIQCAERKKEVLEGLKVNARKVRMELALSDQGPGHGNLNFQNALKVEDKKYINSNLASFEIGTPNPVGDRPLSSWEMKEALRRVERDRKKVEADHKNVSSKNYNDWAAARIGKLAEHQRNYRQLIYQDAPIFAVIDKTSQFDKENNPLWSEAQISSAFAKLSENASETKKKTLLSIKTSKLEFNRNTPEALSKWVVAQKDLLFYIGMKNQVEEVLRDDPKSCGTATSMMARLQSKGIQNGAITIVGSVAGGAVFGSAVRVFSIGASLSGAEAAGLIGLGLGAGFLIDSFRQYGEVKTEALTKSGLGGDKEGSALRTDEEIASARENVQLSLAFAPLDAVGAWGVGKTLYSALSKQISKDLPAAAKLMSKAKVSTAARDQVVDQWLISKIKSAVKSKVLTSADEKALKQAEANSVLEELTKNIEKSNPDFFKNPQNMDFFLKTAASTLKKEKGDPADLGAKVQHFLLNLNTETMDGSWDPNTQKGLYKLFENTIEELRLAFKEDPATYAKFTSDSNARDKIVEKALLRSGAKKSDVEEMRICIAPLDISQLIK
jgi:hypothetical protein